MKIKSAPLYSMLTAAIVLLSSADIDAQTSIQFQTWYGDNLGFVPDSVATKKIEYFYDNDGRLQRKVQIGLLEDGQNWQLTNYYKNQFDEKGNMVLSNSFQYGLYDQNDYSLKATNDTVGYVYNDEGQLVKDSTYATKASNLYTYDENGNCVRKEIYKKGKLSQTLEYSDFVLGGPQTLKATASASYNEYDGKVSYDSLGNKTSELHWTKAGVLNYAEYWTYDENGTLTFYEKKGISGGEEVDGTRVVYENLGDGVVRSRSYNSNNGRWIMKGGSTCVSEYKELGGAADFSAKLVSVVADNDSSTVTLTYEVPEIVDILECIVAYNIYRNGLLVGTEEAYAGGTHTFVDRNVKNGSNEYFIQSVVAGENLLISDIMTVDIEKTYPRVTGLHATTATRTSEGDYKVTLAWKNPVVTEDMGFVHNTLMSIGTYYTTSMLLEGEEIKDASVNTVEVSFGIDPVKTIYMRTKFEAGASSSDTITVDATKLMGKVSEDSRRLRVVETYGDAMGEDKGITKKEITFYGNDNRVQRKAIYAKAVGTDGDDPANWTVVEYTTNVYGESGMLEKQYTQQYGRHDYGRMGYKAATDTTFYESNVEGQLLRESNGNGYTTYEYADDGSLSKTTIVLYGTTDLRQEITYSGFVGKDKPTRTESDGDMNSYKWTLDTEYDENGRKVSEKKYVWSTLYNEMRPNLYEEFFYDENGELSSDTVYSVSIKNDVEKYTCKSVTTYEPEEDNPNRVKVTKRVWDSILKKFGNPKTWNVYEYTDINAEKYSPMLSVGATEGKMNSMTLTVDVPDGQKSLMTAFNIYRKGIEIAHAVSYMDDRFYQADEYGRNGKFVYVDSLLRNGVYDYFVEYAQLDATMEKEAKVSNISNIEWCELEVELPEATGLRDVSRRTTSTANSETGTADVNIFVTLEWDEPENKEAFGFRRYNVMMLGSQIAENAESAVYVQTSYELALRGLDSVRVYIQTEYDYGYSYSDTILVTESGIDTAVESVRGASAADVESGEAYNLLGQPVAPDYKGIVISRKKKYLRK